jgi:hypothetical protein
VHSHANALLKSKDPYGLNGIALALRPFHLRIFRGAPVKLIGVLRLRSGSVARSLYSAEDDKTILYIPVAVKMSILLGPVLPIITSPVLRCPFSPPPTNTVYNKQSTHQQRFGIQSLWFREAEGSR